MKTAQQAEYTKNFQSHGRGFRGNITERKITFEMRRSKMKHTEKKLLWF